MSSRSTGEEQVATSGTSCVDVMAVRDSQLHCTDFVTKFLGSDLDANMQAVCSWLGGTCVHAPHNKLNPYTFQAAQHRLLENIPWAVYLL